MINRYARFIVFDLSQYQGNLYSPFSPGLSILLVVPLAVSGLFGALDGNFLGIFGDGVNASPAEVIAVQLFSAMCTALSAVFVYKLSVLLGARKYSALVGEHYLCIRDARLCFREDPVPAHVFRIVSRHDLLLSSKKSKTLKIECLSRWCMLRSSDLY